MQLLQRVVNGGLMPQQVRPHKAQVQPPRTLLISGDMEDFNKRRRLSGDKRQMPVPPAILSRAQEIQGAAHCTWKVGSCSHSRNASFVCQYHGNLRGRHCWISQASTCQPGHHTLAVKLQRSGALKYQAHQVRSLEACCSSSVRLP